MNKTLRIGLITIIGAFMLAIMPMPDWAVEYRPDWVTLVLIYWAMELPSRIGVTMAWFAGLLLQQAIVIFFLLLIKQLLALWVDGMLDRAPDNWLYFMPTITSTLLWPWAYLILRDLQRKFGTEKHYQY